MAAKLFISYAHEDDAWREALCKHLSQLERDGLIEPWNDRDITGGQAWAGAIDENLEAADLVLLLVSADFLASGYCNDVELQAALRRHEQGLARVIPIIVRACDWQTAAFAGLQAMPKDGRPLDEWKSPDHFFTEVAKGLRKAVESRAKPAAAPHSPAQPPPRLWRWAIIGAGLAALAAALVWMRQPTPPPASLELARHAMASGRYPEAGKFYGQAKAAAPANREAAFGMQKAELAGNITQAAHDDPAGFRAILKTLQQEAPNDADLLMLEGDLLIRDPQPANRALARPKYEEALRQDPALAEAHFRLGILSAREGDRAAALRHYQEAARLEPAEKYQGNLAEEYLRSGDYAKAIGIYENLDAYPLADLEAAKAHWARGDLRAALDEQARALRWLEDPQVAALPKNQVRWALEISAEGAAISVATAACKHYYAKLAQAASRFLLDGGGTLPEPGDCTYGGQIQEAVAEDLRRYALAQDGQRQAAEALAARLAGR